MDMLDIYTDYLICQNKHATGLSDWFGSQANMKFVHDELQKSFIFGIKSNRTLALSKTMPKTSGINKYDHWN